MAPSTDIAKTLGLERMSVDAPGRVPFQKVWLWTTSKGGDGGGANTQYKPETDGPTQGMPYELPTAEEKKPHPMATEYLEVGLVIGEEPEKYTPKGSAKDKARKSERKQRGVLPRERGAMRAFIPATLSLSENAQAKFVVGCKPVDGRLFPRKIKMTSIFFYKEFWDEIPENTLAKDRRSLLSKACQRHAAANQDPPTSSKAPIKSSDIEKFESSHPLAVTQSESLCADLVAHWTLFKGTKGGDPGRLDTMLDTMEKAGPDIKYGPHTEDDAIQQFFDYDEELSKECAERMMTKLKASPYLVVLYYVDFALRLVWSY